VSTLGRAIGGGRDYPRDRDSWLARHLADLDPARRRILLERYGTRAVEAARVLAESDDDRPIAHGILSTGELRHLVERERVVHLGDVVFRRTGLAFAGRADRAAIEEIASGLAPLLGWDDRRRGAEIEDCVARLCRSGGRTRAEFADVDSSRTGAPA